MSDPPEAELDDIRRLEKQVELWEMHRANYQRRRDKALELLEIYDPQNAVVQKFKHQSSRFLGVAPWIAANCVLSEHGGDMLEKKLIEQLENEGCAAGKDPKGGPAAAIKGALSNAVRFGYFERDGKMIRRTRKAPEPGTEGERD